MSRSKKWLVTKQDPKDPLYAVFFTARNKDNKDIDGFMQRKRSFLYHMPDLEHIPETVNRRFSQFAAEGLPGELSRMYISVNPRDPVKIKRELMHELIDDRLPTETPIAHMETVVVSIGMRKGMSTTRHWMFDFDSKDDILLDSFISAIEQITGSEPEIHDTPHGYAVICEHGFDMRQLGDQWDGYIASGKQERIITLKRDDLLCVDWIKNQQEK